MSKFSVGEKALYVGPSGDLREEVFIAGPYIEEVNGYDRALNKRAPFAGHWCLGADCRYGYIHVARLRKLPGDEKKDFIPPEVRKLFDKEPEHAQHRP